MGKENFAYLWPKRGIFKLSGPSAERYLQGRCTQDVKLIAEGCSKEAFILTPQGKIEGKFRINRSKDSFLILTDPLNNKNQIAEFKSSFLKFKVADQFDFIDVSETFLVISLFNFPNDTIQNLKSEIIQELGNDVGIEFYNSENQFGTETLVFIEINTSDSENDSISENLTKIIAPVSTEDFLKFRINNLLPLMGVDVDSTVLAPEVNFESFVSLKKGCYAGQEVVEMATARGRPNRKFIQFTSTSEIPKSFESSDIVDSNGSKVGTLTSSVNTSEGAIGMGFLKTKAFESSEFFLVDENGSSPKLKLFPRIPDA